MTAFEQDIIAIVRGALTGDKPELSPDVDYERIFKFGIQQQIIYLLHTGLCLTDGFEESAAGMRFLQAACGAMAAGLRQQQEIERIRAAFCAHDIDFMPLKGTLLRALYPAPEMRQMGDADILIKATQTDAIAEVMQSLGYTEMTGAAHEIVWDKKGALHVELHRYLVPPFDADMFAFFEAHGVWEHAVPYAGSEYHMTPEDELIFEFMHFVKHFRFGGAGLRHVVDFYLFWKRYPKLNEAYICERLEQIGCADFYRNIHALVDCWFGDAPLNAVTEKITSLLFVGGIYGNAETEERTMYARYRKQYRFAGAARFLHMAFPPLSQQRKRYPILKKVPFLLPITWVLHGVDVLFRRPETIGAVTKTAKAIDADTDNDRFAELEAIGLRVNENTFSKR